MPIVSLLKAEDNFIDNPKSVDQLVKRLLAPLGGGGFYFCPGEKVVILADVSLPAEPDTGVNYDIRLLWALLHLAKEEGAGDITIALRPEPTFDLADVLAKTNYGRLMELDGVSVVGLSAEDVLPRRTDTHLILDEAQVYRQLVGADIIISLAKFKTAEAKLFGGALPNIGYAAALPDDFSYQQKQRALVDVYSIIAPDLTIVDCLRGSSGFQNNHADCLLAGSDAVALDTVLCAIADLDINEQPALMLASQYGCGVSNPADISMVGDDLRDIMYQPPSSTQKQH